MNTGSLPLLILFLGYLYLTGLGTRLLLRRVFNFSAGVTTTVASMFFSLAILGYFTGLVLLFTTLSLLTIVMIFFLHAAVCGWCAWYVLKIGKQNVQNSSTATENTIATSISSLNTTFSYLLVVIFLLLNFYAFCLLYSSRAATAIISPWQTISPLYIYIFFSSTFILGILIWFGKIRTTFLLLLLVVQVFLAHSYLPLTHELLYGADQWRHMGVEQRILHENPIINNLQSTWQSKIGLLSYGQWWGLNSLLAKILSIDLLAINKWLLPVLWSLVFPFLLYEFGLTIGWSKKTSLIIGWLSLLPFVLQAGGSFSLPVNFGFLIWFLSIIMIMKRLKEPRWTQALALGFIGFLTFFGYLLFCVLFWMAWGVAELMMWLQSRGSLNVILSGAKNSSFSRVIKIVAMTLTIILLPILERIAHYNFLRTRIEWLTQFKQLLGNFSAAYLAAGPRPHSIVTGNFIINQIPSYAFVSNLFTASRWWLVIFMLIWWGAVVSGGFIAYQRRQIIHSWLLFISSSLMASYIISRYFLSGEQVLSRRLDIVLSLFCIISIGLVADFFMARYYQHSTVDKTKSFVRYSLIFILLFLLSAATSASYSLGPHSQTVSVADYQAMQVVWKNEQSAAKHCVIADTVPLLALEALSGREIVGGGFPVNEFFSQPELQSIIKQINNTAPILNDEKSRGITNESLRLAGIDNCWYLSQGKLIMIKVKN